MTDHSAGLGVRQFPRNTRKINLGHESQSGNSIKEITMKVQKKMREKGAAGYILLWLLGVPIPVLFLFFLLRGCT
jgi:hypothetical protein